MSENNVYYYEVFLRSTLKNKEYKISLGSLSGSKFKTLDTEFPSSRFLSSVIGGTTSIINNIDSILEYNKRIYNLSANTLKDFRQVLENETYRFDTDRINFSESALGDPNNNNEPYVLVKYNNIISQPENLVNETLTNANNNEYYATFIVEIINFDNSIKKINLQIRSSDNPLPQPPDPASDVETISNYLYNFFTEEETDLIFEDIIDIISIRWFNNFWKLVEDNSILSIPNNKFIILEEEEEPVYEYNKNIKLDGTNKDDEKITYSVKEIEQKNNGEFRDAIYNELLVYINKYAHTLKDDGITTEFNENLGELVFAKAGTLKQFLVPRPGIPLNPQVWGTNNWKLLYFSNLPPSVADFEPLNWTDNGLPEFRFYFEKKELTDLIEDFVPPPVINMNIRIKFSIKSTVNFVVHSIHKSMRGKLTNDDDISENINLKKFKYGGKSNIDIRYFDTDMIPPMWRTRTVSRKFYYKDEDFDTTQNIVKEHDDYSQIGRTIPQPYPEIDILYYEGTKFPSGTFNISVPLDNIVNPIDIELYPTTKVAPNGQTVPDVRPTRSGKLAVRYKPNLEDFQVVVSALIMRLIDEKGRDQLLNQNPEFNYNKDEGFIRNIIEGFRDLLLKKANEKAKDIPSVDKKCLYLSHNDSGELKYILSIPSNEVAIPEEGLLVGQVGPATNINNTRLSVAGNDDVFND